MSALGQSVQTLGVPLCRRKQSFIKDRFRSDALVTKSMVCEFRDRHLKRKTQWLALLSELQPNETRRRFQNEMLFGRSLGNAELIVGVLVEAVVVVAWRAVARNNVGRKLDMVLCSGSWWRRF